MREQHTVHIISHTHWDREWFLNSPYTNEWLVEFFASLFDMLDREPEYRFVLDGQTLMIEDYLDEAQKRGLDRRECQKRLGRYIRAGRLLAGPYYLQPDWQLVSGEALVRNLQIGIRTARLLGGCLQVGWLLDNFGQISQAVQIHSSFGLKGLFLWRGVEMKPEEVRSEFLWESPDGSCLPAVYLLDSYRNAMRLSEYPELFAGRIRSEVDKLKPFATTSNILLMNGYDQEMSPDDILPHLRSARIRGLTLKQSTPGEFLEAVEREEPARRRLKGCLYSGRFISVFPGVLSSRMYLKQMNHRCQRLLESYVEPLSAFCWAWGAERGEDDFESLWKLLLQNHPHDSICGVSCDDVHADMERRLETVAGQAERLVHSRIEKLAAAIDTAGGEGCEEAVSGGAFVVFNPNPYAREEIVTVQGGAEEDAGEAVDGRGIPLAVQRGSDGKLHIRLREIPGCGYMTVRLLRDSPRRRPHGRSREPAESLRIEERQYRVENGYFALRVCSDGSLRVFDKTTGATYRGLGVIEDAGDAGDTYTYSPPPRDALVSSRGGVAEVDFIERGPLVCIMRIKIELAVPQSLSADRQARGSGRMLLPLVTFLRVEAGSPLIRFRTLIKNTVKDHRLRVLFPSGIETAGSFAETQFDVVKHCVQPQPYDEGRIGEELKRVLIGAREPQPVTTFPQGAFVDLSDGSRGLAVLNKGLPEYEVVAPENTVALTLFRSVGWLARGSLLTRTGDAGPEIFTPDAQCLREMEFDYALYCHSGDWLNGRVHRMAEQINSECLVFGTESHTGTLPARTGLLSLRSSPDAVRMTALKRAPDEQALVLRCYNPAAEPVGATIETGARIQTAFYADLEEKAKERIEISGSNRITFRIGAKKIVTVLLKLEGQELLRDLPSDRKYEAQWQKPAPQEVDFTSYPAVPVIGRTDIEREERRKRELERRLQQARSRTAALQQRREPAAPGLPSGDGLPSGEGPQAVSRRELELLRSDVATLERQALESELSLLMTRKKWNQLNPGKDRISPLQEEEIRSLTREIGLKLNRARIKKRTYDYLAEYLRHGYSNGARPGVKKSRGK